MACNSASRDATSGEIGSAGASTSVATSPDGRSERGYAIIEIGDRQRRVIDPAPESFTAPATN